MLPRGRSFGNSLATILVLTSIVTMVILTALSQYFEAQAALVTGERIPETIPNASFVYNHTLNKIDIQAYLEDQNKNFTNLTIDSHRGKMKIGEIINHYSYFYMINPQVLLALMELRTSFISTAPSNSDYLFGPFEKYSGISFAEQIDETALNLYRDYYNWLYNENTEDFLISSDNQKIPVTKELNAGSYAILRFLARGHSKDAWEQNKYQIVENWESTFIRVSSGTINFHRVDIPENPGSDTPEPLRLPWEESPIGEWRYNKTPHNYYAGSQSIPWSSVDFGIPESYDRDCTTNPPAPTPLAEWVVASASGVVVESTYDNQTGGLVVIEHGDGFKTHYLHLAEVDLIPPISQYINAGTRLGHPSCTDYSTGIHLHFSVSYRGEYISITDTVLSGWHIRDDGHMSRLGIDLWPYDDIDDSLPGIAPVILYRDPQLLSQALGYYINQDSPVSFNLPTWFDNVASSIAIPAGFITTLYDGLETNGASRTQYSTLNDFSGETFDGGSIDLDNHISSIKVSKVVCLTNRIVASSDILAFQVNKIDLCDPLPSSENAAFITDVTLPDGTVITTGQSLTKTWRMRNTGSTTWGNGYQLAFIRGDQMGAPSAVDVPATSPGQEVDISVNIIGPSQSAKGYWRLRNLQGTYFGPEIWVDLVIEGSNPPPPTTGYSLACTNCPATVEPGVQFWPTIQATIGSGQLLESRGDMLRNKDGNLYGAWPHVGVAGVVNPWQYYDFTFYTDHPITAPNTEGTYESIWQLWQDGRYVGSEYKIQFQVQQGGGTNNPPNTPTLTGPGDWAVYYGNTGIILSAQQNGDPDGDPVNEYYFEIFESAQNLSSGWITSNSWSPQGLGFNGYQWHVKVRDSRGAESDWSQTWHFNILNNDPQIYSFWAQACWPEWNQGDPDKICFCADTNAGTLKLQVNSANDGTDSGEWVILNELGVPDYECNSADDRPPTWGQLAFETGSHLARLYARREGGWENAAKSDIIVNLAPERRPNNAVDDYGYGSNRGGALPAYGQYVNSKTVKLDWVDTLRTTNYHLEVSTVPDFSSHIIDTYLPVGTSEYDHTFDAEYGTVYWRIDPIGPYGENIADRYFHIDITPPTSLITALPSTTYDNQFVVYWSGEDTRAGLQWYDVQVRDGDRPDSLWENWLVNTTQTASIFQGQVGHTYYFRSRAMDKIGNWESWPDGDGDTYTLVDPSAAPPTPWWDNGYAYKRNLVILNNDTDWMPPHFPTHIQFDDTTNPTAAEIYNASLAASKGDDVRIVYNDTTQLNRFIQHFTSSQIDIWFPLQVGLSGGSQDNTSYQVYYGNSGPDAPPVDLNAVFLPEADVNTMGLWHFQEGSGSTVYDTSGRVHHGSFNGAGWADGLLGWTGIFNGANSYVNAGDNSDFNTPAMTLEAWVWVNDVWTGNWPAIIAKVVEGAAGGYELRITDTKHLRFLVSTPQGSTWMFSAITLEPNRWYHIAAVHNGYDHQYIYINGIERGNTTSNTPIFTSAPLEFGHVTYTQTPVYFPGKIQHVRVSNVARYDFPYARIDVPASVAVGSQQTPPAGGQSDLALLDLVTYPNLEGGILVQAVVQNQGSISTQNGFYTDLYADRLPTGVGDYSGSVNFWVNDPIQAGSTVTLTTVIAGIESLGIQSLSTLQDIKFTIYAQTDSSGSVSEEDDQNNIYSAGVPACIAAPDMFEGDDTIASASLMAEGQFQAHNFDRLDDKDWVKFDAQAGNTYTLRTYSLGLSSDTYLYLYDQDGTTLLASNDDYAGSLASQIEWDAPDTGTHYILVRHWNPNLGGCGTIYSLALNYHGIYLPVISR